MQFVPMRWRGYAFLNDDDTTHVLKKVDKVMPVLKEICKNHDIKYPESANTQRLGRIVVDTLGNGDEAFVDGYYIQREAYYGATSFPVYAYVELVGEDLTKGLRDLAGHLAFKYDEAWDNATFASKYYEWFENGCPEQNDETEAKDTKTYTVSLGSYYTNVAVYKIPDEDAENVKAFVDDNEDEACEALEQLQEWNDASFGDFECYSGEEDCILSYINCSDFNFEVRDENWDVVAETEVPDSRLAEFNFFVTDDDDRIIDVKIPENCPDWMKKMLEKAKSEILKEGDVYLDDDVNGVVNYYIGNFITQDMPEGMMVFCMHNLKGRHIAKIELPKDEEFDVEKLSVIHWSWDDIPNLGEFDGCTTCGIIYDDKYYDLMCDSGDEKWSKTWIQDEDCDVLCEI